MVSIAEYKQLTKKPAKQLEGQHQTTLGSLLNGIYKPRLNPDLIFWSYSAAGERKHLKTAVLQKRKGLQKGKPDYEFLLKDGDFLRTVFLETKTTKGSLTPEQKEFFKKHEGLKNVKCRLSKSVAESIEILMQEGVIK